MFLFTEVNKELTPLHFGKKAKFVCFLEQEILAKIDDNA